MNQQKPANQDFAPAGNKPASPFADLGITGYRKPDTDQLQPKNVAPPEVLTAGNASLDSLQSPRFNQPPPVATPEPVEVVEPISAEPLAEVKQSKTAFVTNLVHKLTGTKKRLLITGGSVVVVALLAVGIVLGVGHNKPKPVAAIKTESPASTAPSTTPNFTPAAPKDKPQLAKEGPSSAYDGARGTFAYTDTYLASVITVSQQYVTAGPEVAKSAAIKMAGVVNATTTVPTSYGTIYIAGTAKTGPQSIVASVKSLLILIQSVKPHTDAQWKAYIESLQ